MQRPKASESNGLAVVPRIDSAFTVIHAPISASRDTASGGNVPSDRGPMFSRKFPPLLAMSASFLTRSSVVFQFLSAALNPQWSFIVMQVSQSRPGIPVAGISCSGVAKSPTASFDSENPPIPARCTSTRLFTIIFGSSFRQSWYSDNPRS